MTRRRRGGKRTERISPLRALADLNVALADTAEHKAARREILARYARITNGKPALCEPPIEDQRMGRISGAFKVIYDTEDNAINAAAALSSLGSPPMAPYDNCEYGPHYHLRTLEQYADEKRSSSG